MFGHIKSNRKTHYEAPPFFSIYQPFIGTNSGRSTNSNSKNVIRKRKEVIISLVNSVGFLVFFLFGINVIVDYSKENRDGPRINSQLSFMVCAGAVGMQTTFLFIMTMRNPKSIVCTVPVASLLSFEAVGVMILRYVIRFDKEYLIPSELARTVLPVIVLGVVYMPRSADGKKSLNQDEDEDERREMDNDVPKEDSEELHWLQAEKLREVEAEALRMQGEIRALKELHELDCSKWKKYVETIGMLTQKNKRGVIEVNEIEKNCVELRKNFDNMRKNCISFQESGKEAFEDAEQALGEIIRSVLLLEQQP